jgi:stearoyl-CoA desaturase (delta-9 desaturase)
MRVYSVIGYALLVLHGLVSALLAPPSLGPWAGLLIGSLYLIFIWFSAGVYLADVMHMGIAHRALDYKEWFIKSAAVLYNTAGIYVNPTTWVNRHRLHHAFSDHDGDPNKLSADGFWKTVYLCVIPYRSRTNLAKDPILTTWPFRLVANPFFAVFSQFSSFGLLWLVVRDWSYALALWCSVRLFSLWVNMIQNYWTHDRRFGTRRYHDEHDNAVNIGDWLPVAATFSACWQNNHHHYPQLLRLTHAPEEFDFGFVTVRVMKTLGLVKASSSGMRMPSDVPLPELGF